MLRKIVNITKELNNYLYKDNCIHGDFLCLNNNRNNIKEITNYIDELECEGASVSESDLDDYIGKIINITIRVSNMKEYYDSFSSFLNKNKTTLTVDKFYIKEIDYFYDTGKDIDNQLISNYFKNIQLINILEEISDYQNKIGTELELFFYKVEKGLKLNVDYNYDDLKELNIGNLTELEEDFFNKPDKEERKQIFVNDLIGLLKDNNNYNELLKK